MTIKTLDPVQQNINGSIGISIILIVLGIAEIVLPLVAALVTETWIAAFILVAGITKLIYAFRSRIEGGFI